MKTYVDGKLIDSATRKILSNGSLDDNIFYRKYYDTNTRSVTQTQTTQVLNVNDYLTGGSEERVAGSSTSNSLASYPYIKSKYNSTWNYRGYLYGEQTDDVTKQTRFYFGEDTSTSVIVSTLVSAGVLFFTGFTLGGYLMKMKMV